MPELPEVETVRRSLGPHLLGRRIERVVVARADVLRNAPRRERRAALGEGATVRELVRHGKQLAFVLGPAGAVHVHLGMSGQLFVTPPGGACARPDHIHVRWTLEDGSSLHFRDPRRFGGVWTYASLDALREKRWSVLGPDALDIRAPALRARLAESKRAIKACLLDQGVLAGVGNIYADESLFLAGIHPLRSAASLEDAEIDRLAAKIRRVLREAVAARGSTLRDFVDAEQRRGGQQDRFRVYGRRGCPCPSCGQPLSSLTVAGRTSTICPWCQPGPAQSC
jgi:formamidopyrimidine-DNA glycosylase